MEEKKIIAPTEDPKADKELLDVLNHLENVKGHLTDKRLPDYLYTNKNRKHPKKLSKLEKRKRRQDRKRSRRK